MIARTKTPPRFIRRKEVSRLTGISQSYLCELEAAGGFPRSVKIARKAVAYVAAEVDAWMKARIADRDATCELENAA